MTVTEGILIAVIVTFFAAAALLVRADLRRVPAGGDRHRRRADLLPDAHSRPDRRTLRGVTRCRTMEISSRPTTLADADKEQARTWRKATAGNRPAARTRTAPASHRKPPIPPPRGRAA